MLIRGKTLMSIYTLKFDATKHFRIIFRFANGFGADARRKRHTADSGYGSEQPLDRRWSQDFSQDVSIIKHN